MGHSRISRRVASSKSMEDKGDCKLLKLHGITSAAQLKIRKLTRREIVESTKSNWFIRDPTVSHNNSKHTLHLCPFAKCEFQGNKAQMTQHKFQSHPTIMPYKCEATGCKYNSNQHGHLLSHLKHSHSILRPQFICTHKGCDFKGSYKANYTNHLIKVHDEMPYVCVECQKGFKTTQKLKHHTTTHFEDKISCNHPNCDYKYFSFQFSDFKIHLMTHTQEKPHKCPLCGWGSRRATHLKLHMQLHEDPSTPEMRNIER